MSGEPGSFVGYEYHSVSVPWQQESLYTDGYESFGWVREDGACTRSAGAVVLKFKRDRKLCNKVELTRLQRQFDACVGEIAALEKSRATGAAITAMTVGLLGCAFLGGATFSYLAGHPVWMVVLAVPGFAGWALPYFCYGAIHSKRSAQIAPLVEKKQDEIYEVCEKASQLLV